MKTALKPWTPAQAGYRTDRAVTQTVGDGERFVADFVPTRHGVIRRVWLGSAFAEIVLRRPGQRNGTYQGSVELTAYGWVACTPAGERSQPYGSVTDAEALLLRLRTGQRSAYLTSWPITP